MRVLVTTEARFDRTPDGACWNVGSGGYQFWRRYLDVFDEVTILGRVHDVASTPAAAVRADGPSVTFAALPYYVGPWRFLPRYPALRRSARAAIDNAEAVILRAPGMAAGLAVPHLWRAARPYGIEVVGDPEDVFAPGGVRTVLRPMLRQWYPRALRKQCAKARAVAYVTGATHQQRYPARTATHVTQYSSIDLPDAAFARQTRRPTQDARWRLISVGSLEQMYKGPDVLLDALASCARRGADVHLTWIGDGKHRSEMELRAATLGLAACVRFMGHLSSPDVVRKELAEADLFVIPSRTEGLPRALIEAMASGLPCIGSDVGGIPELLPPSERVPACDARALADRILELLSDPLRLARLSAENVERAREFHIDVLRPRRHAFYRAVEGATRQWLEGRSTRYRHSAPP